MINYNEKFAKPGQKIMAALYEQKLLTKSTLTNPLNGPGSICGIMKAAGHGTALR